MTEDVAVVGWAQTRHARALERETDNSLIYHVVRDALSSCGLLIADIDVVISAGSDFLDGRGISTCITADAMGAQFREESKVAGDGMLAATYAYMRIASGLFETALVVAYGKSSESDHTAQTQSMAEPFYLRPLGLDALAAAAIQERAYLHQYRVDDSSPARVAVKNRAAGALNPHAELRSAVTLDEVISSRELVSPVRELETAGACDGACVLVMARGGVARALKVRPAWVAGVGHCSDSYYPGSRRLSAASAASSAARSAYERAGIEDPPGELDAAEVSELFAYQELMLYEALGFCGEGEGASFIESGAASTGGEVVVNPSGGAICANPPVATGLVRLAEAAAQVSGRAGSLQQGDIRRALAHGTNGFAMQSASVFVLER